MLVKIILSQWPVVLSTASDCKGGSPKQLCVSYAWCAWVNTTADNVIKIDCLA